MNDLMLPRQASEIIKDIMKMDTGEECQLTHVHTSVDFQLFVNPDTGRRYLVQVSKEYDLFGQHDYRQDYPEVDTYIYVGPQFMFIFYAEDLIADWKAGQWETRDGRSWESSLMLFENIPGFIYDWKEMVLVDSHESNK